MTAQATIFMNNRSQAVRLPAEMRFGDDVKKLRVRALGAERILAPADRVWDSFFLHEALGSAMMPCGLAAGGGVAVMASLFYY